MLLRGVAHLVRPRLLLAHPGHHALRLGGPLLGWVRELLIVATAHHAGRWLTGGVRVSGHSGLLTHHGHVVVVTVLVPLKVITRRQRLVRVRLMIGKWISVA